MTTETRTPGRALRPRDLALAALVTVVGALAVVGGTTLAGAGGAGREDVPDAYWAEEEIASLIESGIAEGYPDNTFRPRTDISREQVATWIGRSSASADIGFSPLEQRTAAITPAQPNATIAEVEVDTRSLPGGVGYLALTAVATTGTFNPTGAGCPCTMDFDLYDVNNGLRLVGTTVTLPGPAEDDENVDHGPATNMVLPFVLPVDGEETITVRLRAELQDSDVQAVGAVGAIQATYTPFSNVPPGGAREWTDTPPSLELGPSSGGTR